MIRPFFSLLGLGYLGWCIVISGFALSSFAQIVQRFLSVEYSLVKEMSIVLLQVPFQWLFMAKSTREEKLQYLLIALTVSMVGSVMLLPLIGYHRLYGVSELFALLVFGFVVGAIFLLHSLLIARHSLPRRLAFTWVLYRLLLLGYVLYPRGG